MKKDKKQVILMWGILEDYLHTLRLSQLPNDWRTPRRRQPQNRKGRTSRLPQPPNDWRTPRRRQLQNRKGHTPACHRAEGALRASRNYRTDMNRWRALLQPRFPQLSPFPTQPFSNSALAQLSITQPFFQNCPQLSSHPTQPSTNSALPFLNSALCFPNSAFAQLSPLPTQPFPNSAFSQKKKQKETINSVLGAFLQSLPPSEGLRPPPKPPILKPPIAFPKDSKRAELEKG
jgi:hypothetical protein